MSLHAALEKAKLLAYTSLCRPLLKYADTLWGSYENKPCQNINMVQNRAIRFIKNIKGRRRVTEAREHLSMQTLKDRRKNHRTQLLMRILSDEDKHKPLSSAYNELTTNRDKVTMTTRAAIRGEPTSVYASTKLNHASFLPKTVRELRIGQSQTD